MKGKAVSGLMLILLFAGSLTFNIQRVTSEVQVGVKTGDWMEYTIEYLRYTRNPDPPWPRKTLVKLDVLSVQETQVTLNLTTDYSNGTQTMDTVTVDSAIASAYINAGIIPANLTVGATFYDESEGKMTISGVVERTYAGARRTVVYALVPSATFYWDKATGVLVEATQGKSYYSIRMKADKTNMWEATPVPIWMEWWFWTIIVVVSIVLVGAFFLLKKGKPPISTVPPLSQRIV